MLKCFKASGDTEFSISDYHLLYCYGSDTNNGNKDINTYDICVPTICVTDHLKVNVSCVSIIYFFKIFFENMWFSYIQNCIVYIEFVMNFRFRLILQILNEWKTFLSNDSTSDIREATCVPSRREKQWFQQFLPIISFFYILLSLLAVCLATIFHIQRGIDNDKYGLFNFMFINTA